MSFSKKKLLKKRRNFKKTHKFKKYGGSESTKYGWFKNKISCKAKLLAQKKKMEQERSEQNVELTKLWRNEKNKNIALNDEKNDDLKFYNTTVNNLKEEVEELKTFWHDSLNELMIENDRLKNKLTTTNRTLKPSAKKWVTLADT